MKKALFAGTFDPPTLGHLDLVRRGSNLCDRLYVGVGINSRKSMPLFSQEERLRMLQSLLQEQARVEVVSFSGLVVDYATAHDIQFLIRGLRTASDLKDEMEHAAANRAMSGLETLFLIADDRHANISSTLIREIATSGSHLEHFVPEQMTQLVYDRARSVASK